MALPILKFNVGDQKTIKCQLRKSDGVTPENITGLAFRFYAKDEPGDVAYTIDPVTATNTDEPNGRFEFDVTMPANPTNSFYWIERDDGAGSVDTFKPAEGTEIRILPK
jgi:hypothetical protein